MKFTFLNLILPALGPFFCLHFGGSSSSSASTTSTVENADMRVVGGANSQNVSAKDSTVNITATDHGAIAGGVQLGTKAIDAASTNTATVLAAGANMFEGALGAVGDSNKRLALAYQSGQAGDQTTLKYAGFIVVGLAAVALLGKK